MDEAPGRPQRRRRAATATAGAAAGAAARVGVLGGTFDPIHVGHLRLAEEARAQLQLDRVLFVPAPNPWRKAGRAISPVPDRLAMVQLAIESNPGFALSRVELDQDGPTYTARTLTALRTSSYGTASIYFILGADALRDLPNWHDPATIVAAARLAVARRPGERRPDLATLEAHVPGITAAVVHITTTPLAISSTRLRAIAAGGGSLRYLVPDAVAAYVEAHGLYRPPGQAPAPDAPAGGVAARA